MANFPNFWLISCWEWRKLCQKSFTKPTPAGKLWQLILSQLFNNKTASDKVENSAQTTFKFSSVSFCSPTDKWRHFADNGWVDTKLFFTKPVITIKIGATQKVKGLSQKLKLLSFQYCLENNCEKFRRSLIDVHKWCWHEVFRKKFVRSLLIADFQPIC